MWTCRHFIYFQDKDGWCSFVIIDLIVQEKLRHLYYGNLVPDDVIGGLQPEMTPKIGNIDMKTFNLFSKVSPGSEKLKAIFFCQGMRWFPVMFCRAGPRSLGFFFVGW